jgi:hypothetical protein
VEGDPPGGQLDAERRRSGLREPASSIEDALPYLFGGQGAHDLPTHLNEVSAAFFAIAALRVK